MIKRVSMGRAMKLKEVTDSRPGSGPRPALDAAITAVVFDLGGVLLEWNPRHLYRRLFGEDVKGMERFLAEVVSPDWNARQDAGRSWDEAIAEAIASHPEHAALIRAYRERWEEMLGAALTDSVAILDELRGRGLRLFAPPNWSTLQFPSRPPR